MSLTTQVVSNANTTSKLVRPEKTVADLYKLQILTPSQFAEACVKLKLSREELAMELKIQDPNELIAELAQVHNRSKARAKSNWQPFGFEDAVKALYSDKPVSEIAHELERSTTSVRAYRYRMFKTGCRINRTLWEMVLRNDPRDGIKQAGFVDWQIDFAQTVRRLVDYAQEHNLETPTVVLT